MALRQGNDHKPHRAVPFGAALFVEKMEDMMTEIIDIDRLKSDLSDHEGRRKKPYDDATGKELGQGDVIKGFITIGVGINLSDGLTDSEIDYLLENRVMRAISEFDRAIPGWREHSDGVQRALVNMAFNMGLPRLLKFKKMWAALAVNDYPEAAKEALDSRWATQVGARATSLAAQIEEG